MAKKVIAIVLVIMTLVSTLTITASAVSYSTGSYSVTASSGVNVRSGAGTSYSKVGAAAKGTTFSVSKISGNGRSESMKITVSNGAKWKTGNFDNGYTAKGYTNVKLNKNAGDGYIRIYTYDMLGKKTSGQIHVTLRDWNGNWICEFDTSSGAKLRLGNNYGQYRVYVAKKQYPDTIKGNGDNFINIGKCVSWAIECTNNCYVG